jgi:hypothetical protein
MDPVFEKAQKRLEEIEREAQEIKLFLKLHQKFSEQDGPKPITATMRLPVAYANAGRVAEGRPTRNLPKHKMADVVRKVLVEERRKPMTRTELVDALEMKGIPVAGTDPSKALGTILWRLRDQFVNLTGWGYWPIDIEYEPADYKPPEKKQLDVFS